MNARAWVWGAGAGVAWTIVAITTLLKPRGYESDWILLVFALISTEVALVTACVVLALKASTRALAGKLLQVAVAIALGVVISWVIAVILQQRERRMVDRPSNNELKLTKSAIISGDAAFAAELGVRRAFRDRAVTKNDGR